MCVVPYDEQGRSGETIEDRPTMQHLLADIDAGRIGAIICSDWNRLSRDEDMLDGLRIKKACKDNGVLVITPNRIYDFSTETDGFLAQLEMMFAASQKQKNIKALVRGWYAKARAGGYLGTTKPYGYRVVFDVPHRDGRPRARLEIDPDEAEVVRLIYCLYADGLANERGEWVPLSQRAVARYLNERGYRFHVRPSRAGRPDSKWRAGEPRLFEPDDIYRITTNRCYIGLFEYGKKRLSKWVRADGPAEAYHPELQVVDVSLWQRAQAVRKERASAARRNACTPHPLSGLLRCPYCGGTMIVGVAGTPRRVVYKCAATHRFGRLRCQGIAMGERPVLDAVRALLAEHLERLQLRRFLDQAAADQATQSEGEIAQSVLVELQQNEDKLQRLVAAVAEGVFTPAEARNVKLDLLEKKERLEARLKKLRERAQVRDELLEAVAYVQTNLSTLVSQLDGARFRALARLVFDHVVATTERIGRTTHIAHVVTYELTEQYRELLATFDVRVSG